MIRKGFPVAIAVLTSLLWVGTVPHGAQAHRESPSGTTITYA